MVEYIYNLPNSTNLNTITTQTINVVPSLSAWILFFVFMVVFLGGSGRQRYRTGQVDFPAWAVVGSVSTWLIALLMSVSEGYLQIDWLIVCTFFSILSGLWFFMDRRSSEI